MSATRRQASRRPKSGPRSMTFTGCWTCKRRKVKCDERPQRCMNCERMDIACDGYGVKLQWMDDPFSEPRTGQSQNSQGRIRIGRDHGTVYSIEEVEKFLLALERDAAKGGPCQRGPFTAFRRDGYGQEPRAAVSQATSADLCGSSPTPSLSLVCPDTDAYDETSSFVSMDCMSATSPEEDEVPEEVPASCMAVSLFGDAAIPRSIFVAVSADTTVNRLMHHYVLHITGLLQPIDHPLNPYRTLYVPAALTAASAPPTRSLATAGPSEAIHAVLLHSLMASSAFHLWNCNPGQAEYHRLGAQHRSEALRLLKSALERHAASIDYKTLMMAMLSLVSIDIMSGCEADFAIHLRGTQQLQKRRRNWRIMSRATRQLNQISDFFFLVTRTTWFPTSPAAVSTSAYAEEDETTEPVDPTADSCYPYMYGISPRLASYMAETCRLAERLAEHGDDDGGAPEPLLEACEQLGDRILSWTHALEEEADGRVLSSSGEPLARAIFRPHAQAWHLAIVIYYFRRIHRCHGPDHALHVRTIAECMHEVEDIKERDRGRGRGADAVRMAPITWPAFIASCEGLHRDTWTRWWRRVQHYRIANIRRQWEMVEKLWQHKDRLDRAGRPDAFDWIEAFRGYGLTLMPI